MPPAEVRFRAHRKSNFFHPTFAQGSSNPSERNTMIAHPKSSPCASEAQNASALSSPFPYPMTPAHSSHSSHTSHTIFPLSFPFHILHFKFCIQSGSDAYSQRLNGGSEVGPGGSNPVPGESALSPGGSKASPGESRPKPERSHYTHPVSEMRPSYLRFAFLPSFTLWDIHPTPSCQLRLNSLFRPNTNRA